MKNNLTSIVLSCSFFFSLACFAETVGKRPYEMDWAGRYQDTYPDRVVADFEDEGWTGECTGGEITVERTREQQLFGEYVLKATYHNTAEGSQTYYIRPPKPIPATEPFDTVTLWAYGNPQALYQDRNSIGSVNILVELRNDEGATTEILMYNVVWNEWFMCHQRLMGDDVAKFGRPGTVVTGIVLKPANNKQPRTLYFDSLSLYTEEFPALEFSRRPKRGLTLFPGQDAGANTGRGTLPFPNREETILPASAAPGATVALSQEGANFTYTYTGSDGELKVTYTPETGSWSDFTASWNGGPAFQPLYGGGVRFLNLKSAAQTARLISCEAGDDGKVRAVWEFATAAGQPHLVTYQFELKGKTLVLDTLSPNADNQLEVVSYGELQGVEYRDLVQIPYYDYGYQNGRPAVALVTAGGEEFFVSGHTDWYRSNGSRPSGGAYPYAGKLQVNGQVRYIPKTDGQRNDVFERFFVTISPKFEEHLPEIPNPQSPWREITGSIIWRPHGAGNRQKDKEYWYDIWRHGMRKCLITGHETMWRDGEESFTFRTKAAPGRGGDEGERDFSAYMQDTLGFVYGPYNNFTDFAPVNEYWSTDMVTRLPSNQLQHAWRRCYKPKPLRGLEFCEKLTPINQEKFHFSTAYCDVHTSNTPWDVTDYDFRVPGAATFAQTYYAYGEIMLIQKQVWNGPVYSEGPHFCYYSGLTDGNYAQDRTYRINSRPWLVDFDLRKIHEKECNFGMGGMHMFYGDDKTGVDSFAWMYDGKTDEHLDRFFAATAAFGHPGFLVMEGGLYNAFRSYYLLQQIETRYTQASVSHIWYYREENGVAKLYTTSEAIRNGAYRNSQLVIDYDNGTHVAANGSYELQMTLTHAGKDLNLNPSSFLAWTDDHKVLATNTFHNGYACDYVESPEYIYLNGRGKINHTLGKADGSGCAVCRSDDEEHWEIIALNGAQNGFAVKGGNARAYAYDGTDLGPATAVRVRGMLYVLPVAGAFSYKLEKNAVTPETRLSSDAYEVFSGDTVAIRTPNGEVQREITGQPGQRIWVEIDGEYICFVIRNLAEVSAELSADGQFLELQVRNSGNSPLKLTLQPNFAEVIDLEELMSFDTKIVRLPLPAATGEGEEKLSVKYSRGGLEGAWEGTLVRKMETEVIFDGFTVPDNFIPGAVILAKQTEADPFSLGARVEVQTMSCGNVTRKGLFMHPCWLEDCHGNSFATFSLELPEVPDIVFSGFVGKKDGSFPGDGMRFFVEVTPEGSTETVRVAEQRVTEHEWKPIEADLSRWKGQKVKLRLTMDIGERIDSSGDWGCWGDLKIARREPTLKTILK